MDILLLILGLGCLFTGILGSLIPVLPGPGISWVGLLLLYLTDAVPINYWVLASTLLVTIIISILDYLIPAKGTKYFGGSSYGIWGTNIGMLIGLFSPIPFGFIIGAFAGALIGELVYDSKNHNRALKAATGSLIGFLASTFMQFLVAVLFTGLFIAIAWQHRASLF